MADRTFCGLSATFLSRTQPWARPSKPRPAAPALDGAFSCPLGPHAPGGLLQDLAPRINKGGTSSLWRCSAGADRWRL